MNNEFHIQQLVSYITGNCSEEEQMAVELWMQLSEDNMKLYEEFLLAWESSSVRNGSFLIDVDSRWDDFKKRVNFETEEVEVPVNRKTWLSGRVLTNLSRIAAVIIVLFGLYFVLSDGDQTEMLQYSAFETQNLKPVVLPDGSQVTLNSGSQVSCPDAFTAECREISFMGEAFFNVTHNPEMPMVITTGDVRVKVLGTSFNLCNCENSSEITVYLETGKILFYSVDSTSGKILEQVILTPGEKGVYSKETGIITKSTFSNDNYKGWKTGVINFVDTPLSEVISVIENTYKVEFVSDLDLNEYFLTARYESESPESILKSWHIIYGFEYEINDGQITLE